MEAISIVGILTVDGQRMTKQLTSPRMRTEISTTIAAQPTRIWKKRQLIKCSGTPYDSSPLSRQYVLTKVTYDKENTYSHIHPPARMQLFKWQC